MNKIWKFELVIDKLNQNDMLVRKWAIDYLIYYYPEKSCKIIVDLISNGKLKINDYISEYLTKYCVEYSDEILSLLLSSENSYWPLCDILIAHGNEKIGPTIKQHFIDGLTPRPTTEMLEYSFNVLGKLQSSESEWMLGGYYSSLKNNTHQPKLIQTCAREFMHVALPEHFSDALNEVCNSLNTKGVVNILCSITQFIDEEIYNKLISEPQLSLSQLLKDLGRSPRKPNDKESILNLDKLLSAHADSGEIIIEAVAACSGFCASTSIDFAKLHSRWEQGTLSSGPSLDIVKILNILTHTSSAELKGTQKKVMSRYCIAVYLTFLVKGPTVYRFDYNKPKLKQTVDIIKRQDNFIPDCFIEISASFGSKITPYLIDLISSSSNDFVRERILRIIAKLPSDCCHEVATTFDSVLKCLAEPFLSEVAFDALCFIAKEAKNELKSLINSDGSDKKIYFVRAFLNVADNDDIDFLENMIGGEFNDDVLIVVERLANTKILKTLYKTDACEELDEMNSPIEIKDNNYDESKVAVGFNTKPIEETISSEVVILPKPEVPQLLPNDKLPADYSIMGVNLKPVDECVAARQVMLTGPVTPEMHCKFKHAIAIIRRINDLESCEERTAREWATDLFYTQQIYSWTGKVYHPRMSMDKLRALKTSGLDVLKAKQSSNRKKKRKKRHK